MWRIGGNLTNIQNLPDFVQQRLTEIQHKTVTPEEELVCIYTEIFNTAREKSKSLFPTATEEQIILFCHKYSVGKLWTDIIKRPRDVMSAEHLKAIMINRKKIKKYTGDWLETFYKSEEWEQLRQIILMRDEYRCRVCGSDVDVSVHHIVPRVFIKDVIFDIDSMDNLIVLCGACHPKADRKVEPTVMRTKRRSLKF